VASGLVGIGTDRRVAVGADYLGRVDPNDGSPPLRHAYAATTYQALGSTVDRAYVMADPRWIARSFTWRPRPYRFPTRT
jgi:hypothetical protein